MEVPRGFTRCDECEDELDYPTPSFTESHPLPVPCPSCSGSGLVPTEKLREDVAAVVDPFMVHPLEVDDCADAVLRKVAEHINQKEKSQ